MHSLPAVEKERFLTEKGERKLVLELPSTNSNKAGS